MRLGAASALGRAFLHVSDKKLAWEDLHMLTFDTDSGVRWRAASALGSAFSDLPDKKPAWEDLHRLTSDTDIDVRISANHSSGKINIYRAGEAESEDVFRKDIESALGFFENASKEATFFNPAKFCLPFYHSFYTLTFKKEDTEVEVQKYLKEAERAVEGSYSKKRLLEAIENLANALKEVQNARDFSDVKADLNAYWHYCDRACELLDTAEDKAPGASKLIRRGLPIIDEKIKGIIVEINEKAKALCRNTQNTPFENLGKDINRAGQFLAHIRDPISLEKRVQNMQTALSAICARMPAEERGDACDLLKRANEEQYVEDKLDLINMVLSKIPSQMNVMKKIDVNINGSGNRTYIDSADNSININTDLTNGLETLAGLLERDYKKEDRREVLKTVEQMRTSCNDPSKQTWLKEKLGWIITRTSEVASISSFAITLLQNVK